MPEPVSPAASDAAGADARDDDRRTQDAPAASSAPAAGQAPTTDEKQPAPPATVTVKILSPVDHDGTRYEAGELTLPLEQAKALVIAGAAGEPDDD